MFISIEDERLVLFFVLSEITFCRNVMAKSGFVPAWMKIQNSDVIKFGFSQRVKTFFFFLLNRKQMVTKN